MADVGNWDTAAMMTTVSIGILCKNTEKDTDAINRGELRPVYELPLSYYSKIEGVDMTWTSKAASAMRPQGYVHNDNLNFGTLTSYNGGSKEDGSEPYFQIRTRIEPWYQRTWDDVKAYASGWVEGMEESLHSYFTVEEDGKVTASVMKENAALFQLELNKDGTYSIRCVASHCYLSITEEMAGEDNIIKANAASIGENGKFKLQSFGVGSYHLASPKYSNRAVYINVGGSTDEARNAVLTMRLGTASSSSAENQRLIFKYTIMEEDGTIGPADTASLEELIESVGAIENADGKYTEESFQAFGAALEEAENAVEDAKEGLMKQR